MSFLPPPLLKSFVGFDELFDELSKISNQKTSTYPAYDICKYSEKNYEIKIAVAGFSIHELELTLNNDILIVRGNKLPPSEKKEIIHKGIATRSFEQKFKLEPYIEVLESDLKEGILTIKLLKNSPKIINKIIDIKAN